ncbi:MAG: hypothetical protein ACOY5R_06295 [Pseudomonadota bacterium]|uniref:hypothetical protein n=1 Tax=Rhizorhabdus phycosphaerae TaxID=2711156 RepID=UPI0013EC24E8|nr:hypothetical protein [Rhizorhabdus phycosphaerae]
MNLRLRAKRRAWLPLLIVSFPLAGFGVAGVTAGGFVAGAALISLAAAIVCFNATAILEIKDGRLQFRRFGVQIWQMSIVGASFKKGAAGDFDHLPGYVFTDANGTSHRVIAHLFDKKSVQDFISEFRRAGGVGIEA